MRYAFGAILGVALLACGGAHPTAIHAGDICTHCKRAITDTKFGAQLVSTNGESSTFHTPGCLAKYLPGHSGGVKTVFVTDYSNGELFSVANALFVRARIDETTGERDYYAFRSATEAAKYAKEHNSGVVDWAAVRTLVAAEKPAKKGD